MKTGKFKSNGMLFLRAFVLDRMLNQSLIKFRCNILKVHAVNRDLLVTILELVFLYSGGWLDDV